MTMAPTVKYSSKWIVNLGNKRSVKISRSLVFEIYVDPNALIATALF